MSGCNVCAGFGDRHDPIAHNWAPQWVTCPTCKGEQTIRDALGVVPCGDCAGDGGWEAK